MKAGFLSRGLIERRNMRGDLNGLGGSNKLDPRRIARRGILELNAYVPGKPIDEVREEYGLAEVVKLASNECALPLPERVVQAMGEAFSSLCRYPDGHCRKLGRRLAALLDIPRECMVFGNGAEECVRLIAQAFLDPGDNGLVPSPVYDAYDTAIRMSGAETIPIPLRDYHMDLEATLSAVGRKTKIVWLCSPANPTGTVIRREDLDRFLARLPENILVVLDEAYLEFVASPDAAHAMDYLRQDPRVIGLRTFSKAYGLAGLRIGYITAHPEVAGIVSMVKLPFNVNSAAQAAALAMLDETEFVGHHVAMIRSERAYLHRELESRGAFVVPSEANFLLVRLPEDSDALFRQLLPKGFIVRPGSLWGLPDFIRLTVGTPEQNRRFLAVLDALLGAHPAWRTPA
jgi:histidinol-phosphate aminotransferase